MKKPTIVKEKEFGETHSAHAEPRRSMSVSHRTANLTSHTTTSQLQKKHWQHRSTVLPFLPTLANLVKNFNSLGLTKVQLC